MIDNGPSGSIEVGELKPGDPDFSDTVDLFKQHGMDPVRRDPSDTLSVFAPSDPGEATETNFRGRGKMPDEADMWRNRDRRWL